VASGREGQDGTNKTTVAILVENAVERDVDGLVVNYADMTRTCVACRRLLGDWQ
jgi:hypothetical protein